MKACLAMIGGLSVALLGGCASMQHVQNPEEYRARMPESYTEKQTIKRPYRTVAEAIAKKTRECLDISRRKEYTEYNGPYAFKVVKTVKYKPTIQNGANKLTVALQLAYVPKPSPDFQNTPPDGMYIMLADVYPSGKDTTLHLYGVGPGYTKPVYQALRNWASGTNMGCPDLSSVG